MTIKIDGTNTVANPAFTGADTDTGLQCGTNELNLVTGGTARATVDSSGNIGVGVTPSSWGGSRNAIQFDSAGAAYVCNDTTLGIVSNMYFDGSNNKYINAGTASSAYFQPSNVVFQFAPSGSADANGTFTTSTRIDADGVKFGSDTAATNALDDYEEGDWTPRLTFSTSDTGINYSSRDGFYVKIGRQVTCWFQVSLTNKGTATGALFIRDLPVTVGNELASTSIEGGGLFTYATNINDTVRPTYAIVPKNDGTYAEVHCSPNSNELSSNLTNTNISNNTAIRGFFTYIST